MTSALNLNTAHVYVRDLASARHFYAEQLGLKLHAHDATRGYCIFNAGNCELVVETVSDEAPTEQRALVGRVTGLSFLVPNIHVAHQDLRARGVVFTAAPQRQFWGGTLALFRDHEGNEFQLVQRGAA